MPRKEYLSVKDLRVYLDEWEAVWSPEDDQYLGKFEDQAIMTDVYERAEEEKRWIYKGVGHTRITLDGTLGFIIEPINVAELWSEE